jgi:hypothetical protein
MPPGLGVCLQNRVLSTSRPPALLLGQRLGQGPRPTQFVTSPLYRPRLGRGGLGGGFGPLEFGLSPPRPPYNQFANSGSLMHLINSSHCRNVRMSASSLGSPCGSWGRWSSRPAGTFLGSNLLNSLSMLSISFRTRIPGTLSAGSDSAKLESSLSCRIKDLTRSGVVKGPIDVTGGGQTSGGGVRSCRGGGQPHTG